MTDTGRYPILLPMKLFVTGSTGLLGRAVYRQLEGNGTVTVIGTGFSRAKPPIVPLNLRDTEALTAYMAAERPDCIIHCAAERRPDVSEADPEASRALNVDVTRRLAEYAAQQGACMIYISTDYVFDGTHPPYFPHSEPHPLNFYGRTKLAGEKAVQEVLTDFTILRVPILYGGEQYPLESSISSVAASLKKNRGGTFDDTAVRYPTYTGDVARVIEEIVRKREEGRDMRGIYHFSGKDALTKYGMAKVMAPFLGVEEECISPERRSRGSAKRPENSHLNTDKLDTVISVSGTSFHKGIKAFLEQL